MRDFRSSIFVVSGSIASIFLGIVLSSSMGKLRSDLSLPEVPHVTPVTLKTESRETESTGPASSADHGDMVSGERETAIGSPTIDSVEVRYSGDLFDDDNLPSAEVPDFQQHVVPLLGRLGCNGRACHGSFQGQGGFQLSLFGFDFESDHNALLEDRVDVEDAEFSLMLNKAIDDDGHGGGQRFEEGSWQYNLLYRWIEGGARADEDEKRLERLVVTPSEIVATENDPAIDLQVVAEWADGRREDVTTLCRFQSNDPAVAAVSDNGSITSSSAGDTHVIVLYDNAVQPVSVLHPVENGAVNTLVAGDTAIDRLVIEKLNKLGIERSVLADDLTFLRRVSLDIAGTLPTPAEIEEFVADQSRDKRARKIDELLETPAYAALWTTFFCDLTGNNSREFNNSISRRKISQFWYDWIYERVENNVPYNEMVEGIVLSTSREPGESYTEYCENLCEHYRTPDEGPGSTEYEQRSSMPYYWMRQNFRDGETRAISFAHAFMGIRIQCAQCHKHPFDQWTQNDFKQFSRFFTGVSTGNVGNNINNLRRNAENDETAREALAIIEQSGVDVENLRGGQLRREFGKALVDGKTVPFLELRVHPPELSREERARNRRNRNRQRFYTDAILLGGDGVEDLTGFDDVRSPVMRWLNQPDNPYFAPAIVNRVWAHYFGVGIVDPADDLNLANPPSNAPLMDYLVEGFIDHGYDLKWLHREIACSRTYQLSWETTESNKGDRRNFSHALPRRLPAEVAFDAVRQAVANEEINSTFGEELQRRTIAIAGTDIPGRGLATNPAYALQIFGKSSRSNSCDCDRSNETSLSQTVWLQNDSDIHNLLTSQESWAREMYSQLSAEVDAAHAAEELEKIQNHLERLAGREATLIEQGKERQLERLRRQVEKLQENAAGMRELLEQAAGQTEVEAAALIERAYLRTLSRYPTDEEIVRCQSFFDESDNAGEGITGLLWALINTKEFIVNH